MNLLVLILSQISVLLGKKMLVFIHCEDIQNRSSFHFSIQVAFFRPSFPFFLLLTINVPSLKPNSQQSKFNYLGCFFILFASLSPEIWDALRAAAEADLTLAQAIVDGAGIIVQNPDLTICYDERGLYTILLL